MKNTYFIEEYKTDIPSKLDEWKVAFPEKVVEKLINKYSKKGNVIFDPFAGFGTTLKVAKKLKRQAFGCDIDKSCINFAKKKFNVVIIEKSAFELNYEDYPKIDLCLFSPPYWGPALDADNYGSYLKKLKDLAEKIKSRMNKGAYLIVIIQNYQTEKGLLTLAWDVGNKIKEVIKFKQDIIWCIDRKKHKRDLEHEAADHHYCLIFKKD